MSNVLTNRKSRIPFDASICFIFIPGCEKEPGNAPDSWEFVSISSRVSI